MLFHMKTNIRFTKYQDSTSGFKDWYHATNLGNCLGQMFKSNAFLSITGLKENKLNIHCPGKLSTVFFLT